MVNARLSHYYLTAILSPVDIDLIYYTGKLVADEVWTLIL